MTERNEAGGQRWAARPWAARIIKTIAFLAPIVISVLISLAISRRIDPPSSRLAQIGWWIVLSAIATVILFVFDKISRRLLPLSALFGLSLIFPDQAPSRFRTALRTGTVSQLKKKIEDAKANGLSDDPSIAAETLVELAGALSIHDRLTRGHSERVRAYTKLIAEEMGLPEDEVDRLQWAGLAHDVGKLFVDGDILNKPGRLTDEEFETIKTHTVKGAELVAPLRGWLGDALDAVDQHHERWDGKGYPAGLARTDIALPGRIVAVADVFDVITSVRSYKSAQGVTEAREELIRCSGTQFDPRVVRAFLNIGLGRLRLLVGPLSWLAQLPVVARVPVGAAAAPAVAALGTSFSLLFGGFFGQDVPAPPQDEVITLTAAPAPARPTTTTTTTTITTTTATTLAPVAPPEPVTVIVRADAVTTDEDTPVTIDVLANDDGELRLDSVSVPRPTGSATILADGRVRFAPAADWSGTSTFAYRALGADGVLRLANITVEVLPVADIPRTGADTATMAEDGSITVDVLANDSTPDGGSLRIVSVTATPHGSAITDGTTVTFVPDPNQHGTVTLTYRVVDERGVTGTGTATITITSVNDAPIASDDATRIDEDTAWALIDVRANDRDPDGDILTITNVSAAAFGTATTDGARIRYVPNRDANGTETLTYRVSDGHGGSDTATLVITVTPIDDAPTVAAGANPVAAEDAGAQVRTRWATGIGPGGGPDEAGQTMTASTTVTNAALFSALPRVDVATGDLTFTTTADANGSSVATLRVSDGINTTTVTFTITINPVNDAPTFTAGADQTVAEDPGAQTVTGWATGITGGPTDEPQAVTFTLTATDTTLFATQPALSPTGTLTYTPATNANGTTTITVTVTDTGGATATATFTITITAVDDDPTITPGPDQTVTEDDPAQTLVGWATDISAGGGTDENTQTLTATLTPADTTLFATQPALDPATGTLTYTPATDANGTTLVTIDLDDGTNTTSVSFSITISPVNDPPSFSVSGTDYALEDGGDQTTAGWVTAVSPGPANESSQTVSFGVTATDTTLFSAQPAIDGNGDLTFTPAPDANGLTDVTVTATDSAGATSAAQTFRINVLPIDDEPSFTGGSDQTALEDSGPQLVPGWATAISPGPANESYQTVSFTVTADNTALFSTQPAIDAAGDLTFTTAADANGAATVTVTAVDSGGTASPDQTFVITITPTNDAPVLDPIGPISGDELTEITFTATASDIDLPPDALTFTLSGAPTGASIGITSGAFTWTPAETDGPGTFVFDVIVTDDGSPTMSDTETITVTVGEANQAPSIDTNTGATVGTSTAVVIDSTMLAASDPDLPAQTLTYTVTTDPVNGAIEVAGSPIGPGGSFNAAALIAGDVAYRHDGSVTTTDSFGFQVDDGLGGTAGPDTFAITVTVPPPAVVTISEIRTGSGTNRDFVEIYNGSTTPIDLGAESWSIVAEDVNGTVLGAASLSGSVPVNGYALAAPTGYVGAGTPDGQFGFALARGTGFSLRRGVTVIDSVGTSSASNFAEVNPLPRMGGALEQSFHRFNGTGRGACVDTDTNTDDFEHRWGANSTSPNGIAEGVIEPCLGPAPAPTPPPAADHVVINEYRTDGPLGGDDEFIEIFNPGPDQDMTGWSIQLNTGAADVVHAFSAGFTLETGRHYLLGGPNLSGAVADQAYSGTSVTNGTGIILWDGAAVVDAVAVETGSVYYEPVAGPGFPRIDGRTYHSHERRNGGCQDTDDNLADFVHHLGFETPTRYDAGVFPCPNQDPTFTGGADITVDEDAGALTFAAWATAISAGSPAEDASQVLTFELTADNTDLFSVQPAIDPTSGDLTFTLAPDANGSTIVEVQLDDDAGGESAEYLFTITVDAVNDAPAFVIGANQSVLSNAGPQTVSDWATAISAGPDDEDAQMVTFTVGVDAPGLFSTQPTVDSSGTLRYTPASAANGTATLTVRAVDDGGTANGGVDTSAAQTATITITFTSNGAPIAVDDAKLTNTGLFVNVNVKANDSDPDGDEISIFSFTQPGNGVVTVNANGTLRYTSLTTFWGVDSFTYTITDGKGGFDTATVTVTVNSVPVATNDLYLVGGGSTVLTVTANDFDLDGDPLDIQAADTTLTVGSVTCGALTCTYDPGGFTGVDTFRYRLRDTRGGTSTWATVTLVVS